MRTDENGYGTKVTNLGVGWGIRVLRKGVVIAQRFVKEKGLIGVELKEMLRMLDKCGNPSPMASASRDRNFCRGEKSKARKN